MDAGERLGASTASSAQGDRPAPALTPLITQTNLALGPPSAGSSDEDHHTPRTLEAPSAEQPRGAGGSSATHSSDVPYSTEYTYTSADPSEKNGGKKEGASLDVATPSTPRASDGMPSEKGPAQTDDATDAPRTWRSRLGDISAFLKGDTDASAQRHIQKLVQEQLDREPAPFRFKPRQLCSLIDPEDINKLTEMGGIKGLTEGLGTHPDRGLVTESLQKDGAYAGSLDDRRRVYGRNVLPERKSKSLLMLMWLALQDKILILLIIAAIVSLALGIYTKYNGHDEYVPCTNPPPGQDQCKAQKLDWVEGVAIVVAVVIVDLVGSLNDWQKERQFRALDAKKEMRDVTVVRDGTECRINIYEVLVGDVVKFEPGEVVPFDGVLLHGHNVKCDESSVTGESDMILKKPYGECLEAIDAAQKDGREPKHQSCFLISGSKVLEGVGDYVVTAVGPLSFNGKLMLSLRQEPENTPLQSKLNKLAELIAKLGSTAGLLLFIALMIRFFVDLGQNKVPSNGSNSDSSDHSASRADRYGQKFIDILIISVTIVVVAVPEGLPLAVTLALAFATRRMSNQNLLVRILGSCETMANATVVCTDKTGTLTQNRMRVVAGCLGRSMRFLDQIRHRSGNVTDDQSGDTVVLQELPSHLPTSVQMLINDGICMNSTAFAPDTSEEATDQVKPAKWYDLRRFLPKTATQKTQEAMGNDTKFIGSKTESALLDMAQQLNWPNYQTTRESAEYKQFIPFSSSRKAMGVVVAKPDGGCRFHVKGASEVLLAQSSSVMRLEGDRVASDPIDEPLRQSLQQQITNYANHSLRTISLCYRDFESWPPPGVKTNAENEADYADLARDLTLIGITAIEDPLRDGVREAVGACGRAGVQVKMCTGDNLLTARSIATQCGIYTPGGLVVEGPVFRQLDDESLTHVVPRLQVLARSSPEDKKKLTEKLKSLNEVVAVTGDGTNDGPALKAANIGFSMGIAGSEVAKEASDIILLDDNFSSIVSAIKWGRCVNDAVRKFLQFQFTVNIVAVVVTFVSAVASGDESSVLTPVQLLWLNLIMDTLAALALATDPADEELLDRKPSHSTAPLVSMEMWKQVAVQSIYQVILVLVLNFRGSHILKLDKNSNHVEQRDHRVEKSALVFNVFVWCQLFNQINCRRLDRHFNIFHSMHRNIWFMLIASIEVGAQVLIIFCGKAAFSVKPLSARDWGISLIAGLISWPLGFFTRLVPTKPIETVCVRLKLISDPDAPPPRKKMPINEDAVLDWNEPAIGQVAKKLSAYSQIRGGRLRASSLVLKKKGAQDETMQAQSLMTMVPTMISASVGSGWKPSNGGSSEAVPLLSVASARDLYKQGKLQLHPETPQDDPLLHYLQE